MRKMWKRLAEEKMAIHFIEKRIFVSKNSQDGKWEYGNMGIIWKSEFWERYLKIGIWENIFRIR